MGKLINFVVLLVFIINLTGCATILKEKTTEVKIDSEPQGVAVYHYLHVYDIPDKIGQTPMKITIDKRHNYALVFKKEGYEDKKFILRSGVALGWQFASFCCAIFPAAVDFFTKNARNLKQTEVKVHLNPGVSTLSKRINPQNMAIYIPDELAKYKKLLDSGAINKEEYEQKKKHLLGL